MLDLDQLLSPRHRPRPHERAVIITNGTVPHLVYRIGPYVTGSDRDELADELVRVWTIPGPGIWVLEIRVRSYEIHTPDCHEYDVELQVVSCRPASDEEVASLRRDDHLWDPAQWFVGEDGELLG